uniref:Integral membrane bound transporter domain-containing protein n=1 Tax=Quercus lobata TaxID=97700 RepID=A0A7N2M565_QUELO
MRPVNVRIVAEYICSLEQLSLHTKPTTHEMSSTEPRTDRTRAVWRVRLGSALRTILACTIVGCTTLYSPASVKHFLRYPAFSYVTTILIVSDATLGDALRGCWHALFANIQALLPSMLCLWVIGPARFTNELAALAVATNAFLVALPESTHLMCKRIAFGQIVIVYVGAAINGAKARAITHPIHVASSTALGVLASLLAMLLPYPHLAFYELRKTCQLYAENAFERLNYFIDAISAQDNTTARDLISQAMSLSKAGAKLLQSIKKNMDVMQWERPQTKLLKTRYINLGEKLQHMELPIRGMEMALNCSTASCIGSMMDEELREVLGSLKVQIGQKFERARCSMPIDATITLLETKEQFLDMYLWKFRNISITQENLSAFFFLYSLELLLDDLPIAQVPECALEYTQNIDTEEYIDSQNQAMGSFNRTWSTLDIFPTSQSLVFAFKCSLSLGLAVLFGLMYNKENGYWSGLTIAISFVTGRQATFTAANARAQGTAMGSVYGILCCYIFQRFEDLRFLAMLPWIIFTNFLMHSRMYGQAGGISAVIGALSILGRTNYTSPSEFAIARISEACIGLICFLIVEILLNPARAATLAKTELSRTLGALQDWINSIVLCSNQKNMPASTLQALREKQNKLKTHFNDLKKFISEAGLEPNFWFLPFHGPCYGKLLESLSKMLDLTSFVTYKIEFLSQVLKRFALDLNELQERMNDDLELFKERVGSSLKHLEKATSIKSLAALEKELQKKVMSQDIELGNSPNVNAFRLFGTDEEEVENIMSSFLRHLNEEADKIYAKAIEEKLKSQIVLCLTGLSFCIGCLIRETMEIEKEVKELVKWENPKNHVN